MMRALVAVSILLLAGCAEVPEPEVEEDPVRDPSPRYEVDLDLLQEMEVGRTQFVALRAPSDTLLSLSIEQNLNYRSSGSAWTQSRTLVVPDFESFLQRLEGQPSELNFSSAGGGGGGGGASGPTRATVRVADHTVLEPGATGSGSSKGGTSGGKYLHEGGVFLYVYGHCNNLGEKPTGKWDFKIHSNVTLERIEIPSTPFLCGLGFDAYRSTVIADGYRETASYRGHFPFGASFRLPFGGPVDGNVTTPTGQQAWPEEREEVASWHLGEYGFDVEAESDSNWYLWGFGN